MNNTVSKNRTATTNKYSYKYADIAQIHDYLAENNMSYYQYIDRIGDDDYIMTVKIIDGKESAPLRGSRVVDATLIGVSNPAQEQGSALTYARRYSLLMAFGLATDDDDAQSLSTPKEEKVIQVPQQAPQQAPQTAEKASVRQVDYIVKLLEKANVNATDVMHKYSINSLNDLTKQQASEVITEYK